MGLKCFCFICFNTTKRTHTHTMLHHARAFSVCARQQPVRACPSTSLSHDVNTRVQAFMNDCLSRKSHCFCFNLCKYFNECCLSQSHKSSCNPPPFNATLTQSTVHTITRGARDVVRGLSELQVTHMKTAPSMMLHDSHREVTALEQMQNMFLV